MHENHLRNDFVFKIKKSNTQKIVHYNRDNQITRTIISIITKLPNTFKMRNVIFIHHVHRFSYHQNRNIPKWTFPTARTLLTCIIVISVVPWRTTNRIKIRKIWRRVTESNRIKKNSFLIFNLDTIMRLMCMCVCVCVSTRTRANDKNNRKGFVNTEIHTCLVK